MFLSLKRRDIWSWSKAMLFVLPALIFYLLFSAAPILNTIQLSLYEWNGASSSMKYVGLQNYLSIIQDEIFWKALSHNIFWICFTVFIATTIGVILAVLLSQKFVKFRFLFRITYYMPAIVSMVAVSVVWIWIFNPDFGMANRILKFIGLKVLMSDWLGNEYLVMWALLTAGSWTHYGFCMVITMAALVGIDPCFLEVALIEGANPVQKFFYVILPLLKNTITLLVVNSLIGSFKVFEIVYLMTRGGPYYSSEVLSNYIYRTAFTNSEFGKGSAIAVILAFIIAICSQAYMRFSEKADG